MHQHTAVTKLAQDVCVAALRYGKTLTDGVNVKQLSLEFGVHHVKSGSGKLLRLPNLQHVKKLSVT